MRRTFTKRGALITGLLATLLLCGFQAEAAIDGLTGPTFDLQASQGTIIIPDGSVHTMWGYSVQGQPMQYPGPTLIVNQGDTVTINLTNNLPQAAGEKTSMVFPGHMVTAQGGAQGILTNEAAGGNTVTYTFKAKNPGTYMYHSGTRPDLQVEMGLVGALIVRSKRPATQKPPVNGITQMPTNYAYNDPGTAYEREYLFFMSEMDPKIHRLVEQGKIGQVDMTQYHATIYFINGRGFPDIIAQAAAPWLPSQPYNLSPMMHPGERVLCRVISATKEVHPYHFHGNHLQVVAQDGRLLETKQGKGLDAATFLYITSVGPGQTLDGVFEWTGDNVGWDIYGHAATDPLEPYEFAADHGKALPVQLPPINQLTLGAFYSGSPHLGQAGTLPAGHPGLNVGNGYVYMWHSHAERELTSHNIYPQGMLTLMFVVPWAFPIP